MADQPNDTPKIVNVAEGFHVRQEVDNIAWIDMGEYGLVVDALEQGHLEREVFDAIHATLGRKPIRYLLNTHTHYDHTALNAAFQRRFGTEIINQRTAPLPDGGRWFEGSRRRAHMLPMGGCHTAEDCVVWFPQDRALCVGDLFGWGLIPLAGTLRADSARRLLDTYARLIDFDAEAVVPGHGPLCSTAELKRMVEYFHWLVEQVSRQCAEGATDGDIRHRLAPPQDMETWWRFVQWKHEDSLSKVLQAVRRRQLTV
jgi:glyoxylase-like metal-dependent hydrolase (beta-lactamase superfamily II)